MLHSCSLINMINDFCNLIFKWLEMILFNFILFYFIYLNSFILIKKNNIY
ncbi:unnamed protein product [Musa acuminata subsp. malaccensis]|uniref:(wild Malaysian banana) hypothetical protein n=1 Tax=Musa acuminata subsp. malaccensis TaxID=214687 RepID=A0A804L010_MUSAM|nr:unnamed protein product [Musa acuminata subsp. malaccensis]